MKRYLLWSLSLIFILLLGCEYDTEEVNYIEIEPPAETHTFYIALEDIGENELIYVYGPTNLRYALGNIPDGVEPEIKWMLNNTQVGSSFLAYEHHFYIDPREFPEGEYTLTMTISMPTNTGSLADVLEVENYVGEKTFRVKIAKLTEADKNLNMRQEISESRQLKIVWDKPDLQQVEVEGYTIYYRNQQVTMITDPDQTEWIDTSYVSGTQTIQLTVRFKNDKIEPWQNHFNVVSPEFSENSFIVEEMGFGKVRISIKPHPYIAEYHLTDASDYYSTFNARLTPDDFPVVVDLPNFPTSLALNIGICEPGSRYSQSSAKITYDWPVFLLESIIRGFYASPFDNILLLAGEGVLYGVDADSFGVMNTFTYDGGFAARVCCDPNSGRKMMSIDNKIYLFQDGSLTNPKIITIPAASTCGAAYAPGNIIYIYWYRQDENYEYHSEVWAIDADSGDYLYTVNIPIYKSYVHSQFSADGRYLVVPTPYLEQPCTVDLYELSGQTAKLLKSFPQNDRVDMHPTNPNLLIHTADLYFTDRIDEFTLIELPSLAEIKKIDGFYLRSDPFTGSIMSYRVVSNQNWHHEIYDPVQKRVLYGFPCPATLECSLINHRLVQSSYSFPKVYVYNLSEYLMP